MNNDPIVPQTYIEAHGLKKMKAELKQVENAKEVSLRSEEMKIKVKPIEAMRLRKWRKADAWIENKGANAKSLVDKVS